MNDLDDLPRRGRSHEVEDEALAAFQRRLVESRSFVLQTVDRKDYGTDCQIEVVADGCATNARVHVQLKGTEQPLKADGSITIEVQRTNLNYLLMQPYSFYACYHVPTGSLRICLVDVVRRKYEQRGTPWTEQKTLTVSFTDDLSVDRLEALAALLKSAVTASRDRRISQSGPRPADLSKAMRRAIPDVHVPADKLEAALLLQQLYDTGADDVIDAAFDRFAAVLGADADAMAPAYMAEINRGMAGFSHAKTRIEAAIGYLRSRLDGGRFQVGSLHYSIGNACSALGDEDQAKTSYEAALSDPTFRDNPGLSAQGHKNLGTSFERLGDQDRALEHYREALKLNPDLPEAHNALANHYIRIGRYEDAISHLDRIVFAERSQGKTTAVVGWRANALFNLGDGRAAFRDINALVAQADTADWIWPWCARLVASFGRSNLDNAEQALTFWQRFVRAHPDNAPARRELLLMVFYLRKGGRDVGRSYAEFRDDFDRHIDRIEPEDAAFLWDRLGHWAQDDDDWAEAERCFRKAYDLDGGHYGYCLGTALNFLDRYAESLPLLKAQAEGIQPDGKSWFQLGIAHAHLGQSDEAVEALEKAVQLDPDYGQAHFELGGARWNRGEREAAIEAWTGALSRFPDHELAPRARELITSI